MNYRSRLSGSVALACVLSSFSIPASMAQSLSAPTSLQTAQPALRGASSAEASDENFPESPASSVTQEPMRPGPGVFFLSASQSDMPGADAPRESASGPVVITVQPSAQPSNTTSPQVAGQPQPEQQKPAQQQANTHSDAPAGLSAPAVAGQPENKPVTPAQSAVSPASASAVSAALSAKLATLAAKSDADGQAVRDFYALRDNVPLWIDNGAVTHTARRLVERMSRADEDGLDASAYKVNGLDMIAASDVDGQANAEIAISSAILAYIRHASSGRVQPRQISRDIVSAQNMPDPVAALATVAVASDPVTVLEGYNPTAPQYLALRRKLAELRAASADALANAPPVIPGGPALKVGMSDTRVAVLRTRLGVTMADGEDANIYDEAVQQAVRNFQAQRRLKSNGVLGAATVAALNASLPVQGSRLEALIIANMERWRWLAHDMGDAHVFVNIPEYKVRVFRDGAIEHEARVVVGKPSTPTPVFSDMMSFVVMNPSWHVPQSIIRNEYMPRLAEDPDYLTRRGYVVSYTSNGGMQVRQPPGGGNALGHIKFMFPNNFSVYLHDTSSRSLFSRDVRAFSHGCVRVDNPYKFAETVMGASNGWTEERVRSLVGKREQRIDLKEKIPVHLSYFTAYAEESGQLQLYKDVYGYDRKLISALGLGG